MKPRKNVIKTPLRCQRNHEVGNCVNETTKKFLRQRNHENIMSVIETTK